MVLVDHIKLENIENRVEQFNENLYLQCLSAG